VEAFNQGVFYLSIVFVLNHFLLMGRVFVRKSGYQWFSLWLYRFSWLCMTYILIQLLGSIESLTLLWTQMNFAVFLMVWLLMGIDIFLQFKLKLSGASLWIASVSGIWMVLQRVLKFKIHENEHIGSLGFPAVDHLVHDSFHSLGVFFLLLSVSIFWVSVAVGLNLWILQLKEDSNQSQRKKYYSVFSVCFGGILSFLMIKFQSDLVWSSFENYYWIVAYLLGIIGLIVSMLVVFRNIDLWVLQMGPFRRNQRVFDVLLRMSCFFSTIGLIFTLLWVENSSGSFFNLTRGLLCMVLFWYVGVLGLHFRNKKINGELGNGQTVVGLFILTSGIGGALLHYLWQPSLFIK
tara:strand:+ start:1125 stop:2168 length:1044 start_codon:yes stop_codon:yes gene_type:complete